MADLLGRRLGQYEILNLLGKGGMAEVYRARQSSMDRDVAIKVIIGDLAQNPDFVTRFEREARLIARLQHPHILPVYDFGREEGLLYLVMRLVEGGSLDQKLRGGALPAQQAALMFTQIASALNYAHDQGIIHRDLKPNNILLDHSDNPYLTDFGIAKMLQDNNTGRLTGTGVAMGTPSYMAPEQWRGESVDARTDIYALGVMLYEMLTGDLPFKGDTPYALMYKHFDTAAPSPRLLQPQLPEAVGDVINKAMAKKQDDRYASANMMARDLNAALAGTAPTIMRSASPADSEQTLVGGPMKITPSVQPVKSPEDATVVANRQQPQPIDPPVTLASPAPTSLPASTAAVPRSSGRLPLIAAVVVIVILLLGGGGLFLISQSNTNATATQVALAASASQVALVAQNATATRTALDGQATQTSQVVTAIAQRTSRPRAETLTAQAAVRRTETAQPTASETPTTILTATEVRMANFTLQPQNLKFHYPADWETKFAAGYGFVLAPHLDALTFADRTSDASITGAPFMLIMVGSSESFNRPDMATARTPTEALVAFRGGQRLLNLEPVTSVRFPTAMTAITRPDLGYTRLIYLSVLGPDRFAVIWLQAPAPQIPPLRDSVALPLMRSLEFAVTPTPASGGTASATS